MDTKQREVLTELLKLEKLPKITNHKYLESLNIKKPGNKLRIAEVLESYGKDKWWLSKDITTKAYAQLFETTLIIAFDELQEGVEKILGRPIVTYEFSSSLKSLQSQTFDIMKSKVHLDDNVTPAR